VRQRWLSEGNQGRKILPHEAKHAGQYMENRRKFERFS
jgi:hypothetical protein